MHPTAERLFEALLAATDQKINGADNPGDAAKALEQSSATISNWKARGVSKEGRLKAHAKFGINPTWVETGAGAPFGRSGPASYQGMRGGYTDETDAEVPISAGLDPAPALRPFRNVPVVGTVQGGDKGYLLELEHAVGHGDGAITYPARDAQSYAVRVRGDSMRPRIKAGEFIVCEPNQACQPGDDVVVVTKDGQRMVKELLYIRDGEATLGSINNGHPNITVPVAEIEKMHYVAAIIPRGAFYKPDQ